MLDQHCSITESPIEQTVVVAERANKLNIPKHRLRNKLLRCQKYQTKK